MRFFNKRHAAVLATAALALLVLPGLLGLTASTAQANEGGASYLVTFTNLTTGQPMTPPVVATHDDSAQLAVPGSISGPEIEAIAEGGNNAPLLAVLGGTGGVSDFGVAGVGPFGPGESVSVVLSAHDGDVLSSINMLICTNDGISGVNGVALPDDGEVTYLARPYDAGTEKNTNRAGDVPPAPPCAELRAGGGGDQDALSQSKKVKGHSGIHNAGPLNFHKHDDVLEITVELLDGGE